MGLLGREALLKAVAPPEADVPVPELGGSVRLRGLTGVGRDQFEATLLQGRGKNRTVNTNNLRAKLVALCAIDDAGRLLFSESDVAALGETRADVLSRLYDKASELSGISEKDADDLARPLPTTGVGGGSPSLSLVS